MQNAVSAETDDCAKGPEHWCLSITNAKECHATHHCIQTVWERQTVAEESNSICDICKEMVQEARDQLVSNETQEELAQVFEGSCNLMPIKLVRMECIKVCIGSYLRTLPFDCINCYPSSWLTILSPN